jgi:hypothetical protein
VKNKVVTEKRKKHVDSFDFDLPTRSYNDIVSSTQKLTSKCLAQATGAVEAQQTKNLISK